MGHLAGLTKEKKQEVADKPIYWISQKIIGKKFPQIVHKII